MSKPLTPLNREFKADANPRLRWRFVRKPSALFPSYFGPFCIFARFLMLQMSAALVERRLRQKHEIPPAAAIMAIV
jgi:hypothetical protein